MTRLTEAEWKDIEFKLLALAQIGERRFEQTFHWSTSRIRADVERIIDARLAPIRALAERYENTSRDSWSRPDVIAHNLRAALRADLTAPQPTSGTEGQQ